MASVATAITGLPLKALTALVALAGGGYLVGKCVHCVSTQAIEKLKDNNSELSKFASKLSELKPPEDTSDTAGSIQTKQKSDLSKKVSEQIITSLAGLGSYLKSMSSGSNGSSG